MRAFYRFLPLFGFFLLLTPGLALAISCTGPCDYVWNGIFGFKTAWLNEPRELIVNAFIPSAAIYVFTLGLLRATGMNQSMGNMEHAVAIIVMLSALFTGGIGAVNTWALVVMGQFAFWGYVIVFLIAGGFFFATKYLRSKRGWRAEKDVDNLYVKDMDSLDKKITEAEGTLADYKKQAVRFGEVIPRKDGKGMRQVDAVQAKAFQNKAIKQEVYIQQLYEAKKKLADTYKTTKAI